VLAFILGSTFIAVYWPRDTQPDGGRAVLEGAGGGCLALVAGMACLILLPAVLPSLPCYALLWSACVSQQFLLVPCWGLDSWQRCTWLLGDGWHSTTAHQPTHCTAAKSAFILATLHHAGWVPVLVTLFYVVVWMQVGWRCRRLPPAACCSPPVTLPLKPAARQLPMLRYAPVSSAFPYPWVPQRY